MDQTLHILEDIIPDGNFPNLSFLFIEFLLIQMKEDLV